MLETLQQAYTPWLGQELVADLLGRPNSPLAMIGPHGGRYVNMLLGHLERREGAALGLEAWPNLEAWRDVLARGLSRTTARLHWLFGGHSWNWGQLHRVKLKHGLGMLPGLGWLLNGPDAPIGGDTDTVLQTAVVPSMPYRSECWAPSWRMVADLASPTRVATALPSGQSGHWRNRFYLDAFPGWHSGRLRVRALGDPKGGTLQQLDPG